MPVGQDGWAGAGAEEAASVGKGLSVTDPLGRGLQPLDVTMKQAKFT